MGRFEIGSIVTEKLRRRAVPTIRFTALHDSKIFYEAHENEFFIGRSKECLIQIIDTKISRHHARVKLQDKRYFIENIGQNPVSINDRPVSRYFLKDGDRLHIGRMQFLIRIENAEGTTDKSSLPAGKKPPAPAPGQKESIPRLVLDADTDKSESFPVGRARQVIGRSADADIYLDEKNISREHCAIEKHADGYFAVKLSHSTPLLVNRKEVEQERLYTGDEIRIGPHVLNFISDRPEDAGLAAGDETIFSPGSIHQELGPRLLLDTVSGQTRSFPINLDRLVIGRSPDADIHLDDRNVSRMHCAIEKQAGGYYAVKLSRFNPLLVNKKNIDRQRINSGDQIQVGSLSLILYRIALKIPHRLKRTKRFSHQSRFIRNWVPAWYWMLSPVKPNHFLLP